jgi:formylglycine-generating enzyme required for sulfatase activity
MLWMPSVTSLATEKRQFRVFAHSSEDAWDGWHPPVSLTDEHPATVISWEDANRFAKWLSQKEQRSYRLPKEAEWEFACRAGTDTPWHTGKEVNALQRTANVGDASLKRQDASKFWAEAWDDGFAGSAPVGGLESNAFGLYDMHGNLYEWCADWYSPDAYQSEQVDDLGGPDLGTDRVVRGGSYKDKGLMCRSAARAAVTPNGRLEEVGIRVLLEVP